jgi:hypothetical protein
MHTLHTLHGLARPGADWQTLCCCYYITQTLALRCTALKLRCMCACIICRSRSSNTIAAVFY